MDCMLHAIFEHRPKVHMAAHQKTFKPETAAIPLKQWKLKIDVGNTHVFLADSAVLRIPVELTGWIRLRALEDKPFLGITLWLGSGSLFYSLSEIAITH